MGSNDMPELGSKISLISRADIRYEGKLFTVDPQDCTIALANVRSFGTEDRATDQPVPAQTQVYDYILFRATDIKDINVIPPQPVLYDPAILQLSAPPSINRYNGGFSHPVLGQMGEMRPTPAPSFNPMQSGFNPMQPTPVQSAAPAPPSLAPSKPPPPRCVADLLERGASRSSTPGAVGTRRVSDQGTQANRQQSPPGRSSSPRRGPRRNNVSPGPPQHQEYQQRRHNDRRLNQGGHHQGQHGQHPGQMQGQHQGGHPGQHQGGHPGQHQGGHPGQHQGQGPQPLMAGLGGLGRGGWRGRNNGPRQRQPRPFQQDRPLRPANKQPLKFDSDYDFDKANTEFEELRLTLATQLKISTDGEVAGANGAAGPVEGPVKDDSGNETAVGEVAGEEEDAPPAYDKAKSFFDNLSCDGGRGGRGRSLRQDWKKELKLNSETFGVSSNRRYYPGRGRGYSSYYNRGWGTLYSQYKPRQNNNMTAKA